MLRLLITCFAVSIWPQLTIGQESNVIPHIFNSDNEPKTIDALKCSGLVGTADSCLACYTCTDDRIKSRSGSTKLYNLTLKDSNCVENEVCCIPSNDLEARQFDNCGRHNPEGNPRRRRPSLRSVQEMEYPWRASVYSYDSSQPLCAATYVNMGVKALVTTATCIRNRPPSSLNVKFSKTQQHLYRVNKTVVHPGYYMKNGVTVNDIALLTLTSIDDARVGAVCTQPNSLRFATSCVSVSDVETSINTLLPQQKKCSDHGPTVDFNGGAMCTFPTKGDYIPQHGAGLYCLYDQAEKPTFMFQGIYQENQTFDKLSLYTNVTAYVDWLFNITSELSGRYNFS